jgi:hypothetical protein
MLNHRGMLAFSPDGQTVQTAVSRKELELETKSAIICNNNTPPASRQISAPRGVSRFWVSEI